jgi:hypothetical protein
LVDFVAFGLVARQYIMEGRLGVWQSKLFISRQLRSRERGREGREGGEERRQDERILQLSSRACPQ